MPAVLVVNPNSNSEVTAGIDAALDELRSADNRIDCVSLSGTPAGIQSQHDVDAVALPTAGLIAAEQDNYDAFVIACFSDPGLHVSRESSSKPVLGIAQTGMFSALSLGQSVGVISILSTSIPRHWRFYRSLGIADLIAGDLAIDTPVSELADEERVRERMLRAGEHLVSAGADVLVMGCAGMARYRSGLQAELGVPVVDPTQAAVGLALTAAAIGWSTP